jgi:hypothetical protein
MSPPCGRVACLARGYQIASLASGIGHLHRVILPLTRMVLPSFLSLETTIFNGLKMHTSHDFFRCMAHAKWEVREAELRFF